MKWLIAHPVARNRAFSNFTHPTLGDSSAKRSHVAQICDHLLCCRRPRHRRTNAYRRVRCPWRSHARHLELATICWKRRRYTQLTRNLTRNPPLPKVPEAPNSAGQVGDATMDLHLSDKTAL